MRKAYHEELDRIAESLVEMTHLAASAMSRATTALLDADVHLADSVITADAEIDARREQIDLLSFDLLALQQPVATDLRVVVTSMRMSSDIERMGDLARHVAKVARLRYPASAVPPELRGTFREMGQVAELIVEKVGSVIAARDVDGAREIARDDDVMDALHRELFEHVTGKDWPHDTETAVDITLLGRYYERFADHAVSVAERVVWIVTGAWGHEANGSHEDAEDASTTPRIQG
ncbi:phosphate signaling complex protein PhoU [Nostocoides sp. Soil756]|jgi:phosphate transport system protein|uniref:phosphate signaling complex protein PhoU n=1 Tax=Nostocoides sp. Soil756 TaxID=1736399 RepID=UPI0006FF1E01|nr:phosphate signaling complex protein PhoU [Tetrasphaera sp. Soil756]KRE60060.1 PhoU family transcriptional regulator [Tetrasphaera sp. Soil756]